MKVWVCYDLRLIRKTSYIGLTRSDSEFFFHHLPYIIYIVPILVGICVSPGRLPVNECLPYFEASGEGHGSASEERGGMDNGTFQVKKKWC